MWEFAKTKARQLDRYRERYSDIDERRSYMEAGIRYRKEKVDR